MAEHPDRGPEPSEKKTQRVAPPEPIAAPTIVAADGRKDRRRELLAAYPWLIYVFPLFVFMVMNAFEPTSELNASATFGGAMPSGWTVPYSAYPFVYTLKIVLTLAAMAFVWPGYRQFPWRLSPLAFVVGAVGAVLWVGLCELRLESKLAAALGIDSLKHWLDPSTQRSAFNPFQELAGRPALVYSYLAVRFFGLVAVVAVIEEFFLRGFLVRFCVRNDWWNVPIGQVNATAVAAATLVPVLMHPAEMLAAAAWFSLVTWLLVKTRNIWDCVVAHGVTNLLMGAYVLYSGEWRFL